MVGGIEQALAALMERSAELEVLAAAKYKHLNSTRPLNALRLCIHMRTRLSIPVIEHDSGDLAVENAKKAVLGRLVGCLLELDSRPM
ncbi:hypothetical protein HDU99_006567, partial [Rhizoclosmatium hyalinum]